MIEIGPTRMPYATAPVRFSAAIKPIQSMLIRLFASANPRNEMLWTMKVIADRPSAAYIIER